MNWSIRTGDCLPIMAEMEPGSVDLCFCDPPFGIGYRYDVYKDNLSSIDYYDWTYQWMYFARRVLKPTGALWVMIGDENVLAVLKAAEVLKLTRRNWVVWHFAFGPHQERKFGRDKNHLLYFVKDPECFTFNADPIRIPSARLAKYKDKRANPKGRVPGDVWSFPRICGTFKKRTGHPAQMPEEITDRIVLACSNPGDLVLDPQCGSGTCGVSAVKHGRRFLGIELSENYAEAARQRVKLATKS